MPSRKCSISTHGIVSAARSGVKSPIYRLPVELLVSIFTFCMADAIQDDAPREEPWLWLHRLSLVCGHWASVVLRTPCLWTYVVLPCDNSFLRTAFRRSKSLPLDIIIHTYGEVSISRDSWAAIVNELRRVRSLALWPARLAIEVPGSTAPNAETTLLPTSWDAPLLSQLVLRDFSSPYLHSLLNSVNSAAILTSLTVTMHPRVWHEVSRFSSLKKLTIWPMRPAEGYAAPVATARTALTRLSSLECLEAFCCFVDDPVQQNPDNRLRVPMPNLKVVVLTGSAFDSGVLLRHMLLRYGTMVTITDVFMAHRRLPEAALQLAHTVPVLVDLKRVPIVALGLQCVPNAAGEVWRDQLRMCCWTPPHGTSPQVSLSVQDSAFTARTLLAHLPAANVRGLSLTGVGCGRARGIDAFLHVFANLIELVLVDTELTWVYTALLEHRGLFPRLRTLKVVRYKFLSWCLLGDTRDGPEADVKDEGDHEDESAEARAARLKGHTCCVHVLQSVVELVGTLETLLLVDCEVVEEVWPAIVQMAPNVRRVTKAELVSRHGVP
ncbi:hypothetical protein PsYK624_128780 [Phanerochaete sordida]|uniref:F-box domain-containing protein n=1 Tax=Phanerochaete sordida TaxID=48140 RepID=A0A9P3GL06_9APHY|nr:hypothetical protein PsYK624_128780 [Phanerochaete sordida]